MKSKIIALAVSTAAIAALAVLPAFAQTSVSANLSGSVGTALDTNASVSGSASSASSTRAAARVAQRMQDMQTNGGKEISARITALNNALTRIQGLKNVSDTDKATLEGNIQTAITDMNNVQSQVSGDTSTTTLRASLQSITQDYRIYALVIPQTSIIAATDRVTTIVAMMDAIQTKIQARLATMSTVSSAVTTTLSDMTAKLADAASQSQAAQVEISALVPDQGNQTVMASNTAALKDARTKIQAATKDLTAARADIKTAVQAIVSSDKSLSGTSASVGASASATASTSGQ